MNTTQISAQLAERVDNAKVPNFGAPQAQHVFKCLRAMLVEAVENSNGAEVIQFFIRQLELEKESRL